MATRLFISNSKDSLLNRIPKALILLLLLIVITELSIYFLVPFLDISPEAYIVNAQVAVARTKGLDKDILIFGDSSAGAINMKVLREYTGLTGYNFSTFRNVGIAGNYFLFESYLKNNSPPKFAVLMMTHDGWFMKNAAYFGHLIDMPEEKKVVEDAKPFHSLAAIMNSFLPSRKHMITIRRFAKTCKFSLATLRGIREKLGNLKNVMIKNDGNIEEYIKML